MVHTNERQRRGALGESLAARYLELVGCTLLARRCRVAEVEVDLIVREANDLVLVEVKLRATGTVPATDALRPRQWARLRRAASVLLWRHAWAEVVRIDLVSIDWSPDEGRMQIRHLRGVQP